MPLPGSSAANRTTAASGERPFPAGGMRAPPGPRASAGGSSPQAQTSFGTVGLGSALGQISQGWPNLCCPERIPNEERCLMLRLP